MWPPPTGCPTGTTGWFRASDGVWYRSDEQPAPGYVLGDDGRWRPYSGRDEAERGQLWRTSNWGLGDAAWGALAFVLTGVVGVLVFALSTDDTEQLEDVEFGVYANAAFIALNAIALFGIPWLASRRKGLRSVRLDFGLTVRWRDPLIGFGIGIGALVTAGFVSAAVDAAFGVEERTSNVPIDNIDGPVEFVVFFLAVAVLTPVIEELFFRGLVYRSFLKRGSSTALSAVATTAIFTVPHLLAAEDVASLVTLAATIGVLGAAFQLACITTEHRLAAPITAHAVVNATAVLALAFS